MYGDVENICGVNYENLVLSYLLYRNDFKRGN
jgi:hypothetical protein